MTENIQVVVIGGGYAGVMAANRLTQRDDVTVTLVNPRPDFVERVRLHQVVGGSCDAVVPYTRLLAAGVRLVVDTAAAIDPAGRRVALGSGGTIRYDYLVYAVGSGGTGPGVPGAVEFAHPLATLEDARRLRSAVAAAPPAAAVTVVGAGPTGIETAAELAEGGRAVVLAAGAELGPYLHPRARRSVARRLARLGVTVLEGPGSTVTAVARDAVRLADGREVLSHTTIWTAGFGVPDLAARSGLRTDPAGRLVTDETLTSVDDARVVAVGDAAAPAHLPFRMSCQAAVQLGPQGAETVLSRIAGTRPVPATVTFVGMCLSLGRRAGLVQASHRDDTATAVHLGGRPAAQVKEFLCRNIGWQLRYEARHPGAVRWWLTGGPTARTADGAGTGATARGMRREPHGFTGYGI